MAHGTTLTCNVQGFFIQLGIVTPLYNGMLAIYYLFSINRGWKEYQIHRIEKYLHAIPILWGVGTATGLLIADQYMSATLWCWLGLESIASLRYWMYYGPVIIMLLLTTAIMIKIYAYVREQERAVEKYDFQRQVELEEMEQQQDISEGFGQIRKSLNKATQRISYVSKNIRDIIHGSSVDDDGSIQNGFSECGSSLKSGISTAKGADGDTHYYDSNQNSDAESDNEEVGHEEEVVGEYIEKLSGEKCNGNGDLPKATEPKEEDSSATTSVTTTASQPLTRRVSKSLKDCTINEEISHHFDSEDFNDDHRNSTLQKSNVDQFFDGIDEDNDNEKKNHLASGRADPIDAATDSDDNDNCLDDSLWSNKGIPVSNIGTKRAERNMKRRTRHSKRVMWQSFWYIVAFYLSFIFAVSTRLYGTINKPNRAPFPLFLLFSIFFPLQGFFNFLVYMRSRFSKNKKRRRSGSNPSRSTSYKPSTGSFANGFSRIFKSNHKRTKSSGISGSSDYHSSGNDSHPSRSFAIPLRKSLQSSRATLEDDRIVSTAGVWGSEAVSEDRRVPSALSS